MQMVHSSCSTNDTAVEPPPGKTAEDLNAHIASYLAVGWQMAFYAVHPTASGSRHHFIWSGPEEGSPLPTAAQVDSWQPGP
jgi:hypothetical protein